MNIHQNPSRGSRVVPQKLTDGRTNTTKLIVAFRNFGKASVKTLDERERKQSLLYSELIYTILKTTAVRVSVCHFVLNLK
jgi:hypothetical protein